MKYIAMMLAFLFAVALTGCDTNDGPAEELGEDIDEAAEEVGDDLEDAADDLEDATDPDGYYQFEG